MAKKKKGKRKASPAPITVRTFAAEDTTADARFEVGVNEVLRLASRAYVLLRTIADVVPEERRDGMYMEEIAALGRTIRAVTFEPGALTDRAGLVTEAIEDFVGAIDAPVERERDLAWSTLRTTLQFGSVPLILMPEPVLATGTPTGPIEQEYERIIAMLEELMRRIEDPAVRAKIQEFITKWREIVRMQGPLVISTFLMAIQDLFYLIRAYCGIEAVKLLFHELGNACMRLMALGGQVGAVAVHVLVRICLIFLALGVGIAIGTAINRIPVGDGDLSDHLGNAFYHAFFESDADMLLAAQDVLVGELGEYEDRLNSGPPLTPAEAQAGVALAAALISLFQRKLDIDAEPRNVVTHRLRRTTQTLERLVQLVQ